MEGPVEAGGVDAAVGLDDAADVGLADLALDLSLVEGERAAGVMGFAGCLVFPGEDEVKKSFHWYP